MDLTGLMLVILSMLFPIVVGAAGYLYWKYWQYHHKTPAPFFLKARKEGKLVSIDVYETGLLDFKTSEDKEFLLTDTILTEVDKVFSNPKYHLNFAVRYIAPGTSGKTINPKFVAFTDLVKERMKKKNISREEAINEILEEQEKNGKVATDYGYLDFKEIKDYLMYNDGFGNYTMAQKMASVLAKKGWQDILKYIVLMFFGAIALIAVAFVISKLAVSLQKPEIIIKGSEIAKQIGTNITQNATIVKP